MSKAGPHAVKCSEINHHAGDLGRQVFADVADQVPGPPGIAEGEDGGLPVDPDVLALSSLELGLRVDSLHNRSGLTACLSDERYAPADGLRQDAILMPKELGDRPVVESHLPDEVAQLRCETWEWVKGGH